MDLYRQELMHHYRYPKNKGILIDPHFCFELLNPSCGDSVSIQGIIEGNILSQIAFTGSGCVISQAACSMITEHIKGWAFTNIQALTKDNIVELIGMNLGPVRLRCALLPLEAIQQGIAGYLSRNK